MRRVVVTRGWTVFVNDFGRLAPKTNAESVMNRMKYDWMGLIHWYAGVFFVRVTLDVPVIQANALRVRNNLLLNAFGG